LVGGDTTLDDGGAIGTPAPVVGSARGGGPLGFGGDCNCATDGPPGGVGTGGNGR
jgi:hypothetical protein